MYLSVNIMPLLKNLYDICLLQKLNWQRNTREQKRNLYFEWGCVCTYMCVCVLPVTLCGRVHLCEYRHKVVTLIILDKGLGREGEMRNSWSFFTLWFPVANCCFHSQHVWLLLFERKTQWSIKQNKIIIVCGTPVEESGPRSLSTCHPKFTSHFQPHSSAPHMCAAVPGVWQVLCLQERDGRLGAYTLHPAASQVHVYVMCEPPRLLGTVTLLCNCNSFCTREMDESSGGTLVAQSRWTLCSPWTVAPQAPLSAEFSRQEYWSGLPLPSSEDLTDPGIKPGSSALQADSLPTESPGPPKEGRWGCKSGGRSAVSAGVSMMVFADLTSTWNFTKPPKRFPVPKRINRTLHWSWIKSIQKRAFAQQVQGLK